jgi:hypothetical protein
MTTYFSFGEGWTLVMRTLLENIGEWFGSLSSVCMPNLKWISWCVHRSNILVGLNWKSIAAVGREDFNTKYEIPWKSHLLFMKKTIHDFICLQLSFAYRSVYVFANPLFEMWDIIAFLSSGSFPEIILLGSLWW